MAATSLCWADATSATGRTILGVPLYVSQYVAANTLWAIDSSRVWLVVRDDTIDEADRRELPPSPQIGHERAQQPQGRQKHNEEHSVNEVHRVSAR
jgi:hypothetical protein